MLAKRFWANLVILFGITVLLGVLGSCSEDPEEDSQIITSTVPEVVQDSPLGRKLEAIAPTITNNQFSGVILITRGDETLLLKAYGLANRDTGQPNTVTTLFDSGSIAKSFTAMAILQLAEAGSLSLDDTLAMHFKNVPEDKAAITLHQVITHSAGLPLYHSDGDEFEQMSKAEAFESIMETPLRFMPGEGYRYSNSGHGLLAMIIEDISGQSWQDYLAQHIFSPAGMANTGFPGLKPAEGIVAANGYEPGDLFGHDDYGAPDAKPAPSWVEKGAGGLITTVLDLQTWFRALQAGGLLSDSTREVYFNTGVATKPYRPGRYDNMDIEQTRSTYFGWEWISTSGQRFWERGGSTNGYFALMRYHPDNETMVIILSNHFYFDENDNFIRGPIIQALSQALQEN